MTADPLPHLKTLGLEAGASREDVKKAYRDLSKVWHPDRFGGDPKLQKKAEEQLKTINDAYRGLESYEPVPDMGIRPAAGRPHLGRKVEDRVLRPRKRFNPTERMPLVAVLVVVVVVILLVLSAL